MINTKNIKRDKKMGLTPEQRKKKVVTLRKEHEDYFQVENIMHALYIPKMAYRPSGKDELYVSFFPSELEKDKDVYTEFVSIDYDSEDPKRTLYLHKHNPHWKEEYELITSSSGFQRHLIPVSELKIINDVTSRGKAIVDFANPNLPDPDTNIQDPLVGALNDINDTLNKLINVIKTIK